MTVSPHGRRCPALSAERSDRTSSQCSPCTIAAATHDDRDGGAVGGSVAAVPSAPPPSAAPLFSGAAAAAAELALAGGASHSMLTSRPLKTILTVPNALP